MTESPHDLITFIFGIGSLLPLLIQAVRKPKSSDTTERKHHEN